MITVRKLESLPRATRLRRIVKILAETVHNRRAPEPSYLRSLCRLIREDIAEVDDSVGRAVDVLASLQPTTGDELIRRIDDLHHALMAFLGIAVADWDLAVPFADRGTPESPGLPSVGIYLDSIRSPFNLGSIVRTSAAFGVSSLGISPETVTPDHPRARRSAMGSFIYVDIFVGKLDEYIAARFPTGIDVVALETDGDDIGSFSFPPAGVLVLGSEGLGIRESVRALATKCVRIPMRGEKRSLNVGVACGIALHAWLYSTTTS